MALPFLTSAAAAGVVGYLSKGIGSKLIAFVVMVFICKAAFVLLGELIPEFDFVNMLFGLPGAFLYGLWYIDAPFALNLFIPAYALAFMTKRIPVVG